MMPNLVRFRNSKEFKAQILSHLALSENMQETAQLYNISPSTVFYWRKAEKEQGTSSSAELPEIDVTYEYKIKTLQARVYQLEEENLILLKAAKLFASAS